MGGGVLEPNPRACLGLRIFGADDRALKCDITFG